MHLRATIWLPAGSWQLVPLTTISCDNHAYLLVLQVRHGQHCRSFGSWVVFAEHHDPHAGVYCLVVPCTYLLCTRTKTKSQVCALLGIVPRMVQKSLVNRANPDNTLRAIEAAVGS